MSRIVLHSDQLMGDTLMMTPAIRNLAIQNPDSEIVYWVPRHDKGQHLSNNHLLLRGSPYLSGIFIEGEFEQKEDDTLYKMDPMRAYIWACANGKTISQGFGHIVGVEIKDDDLKYEYYMTDEERDEGHAFVEDIGKGAPVVIVARHSASCASNDPNVRVPNKCILNTEWNNAIQVLSQGKLKDHCFVAVGSEKESRDIRYAKWSGKKAYGLPLRKLAAIVAASRLTLSIDTGIRHLASAVGCDLYCVSGTIPIQTIKCVPTREGQRIFEELCPILNVNANQIAQGVSRVL